VGQDDITRIAVGLNMVGMVGLKQVLEEVAAAFPGRGDEEIRGELLERLSKKNYIPTGAREVYGDALLREYNKHLGRPYQEKPPEGLEIIVLGPGCSRCNTLEQIAMEVVEELGLAASVEHVTDVKEIGRYGVMGTPALVINGKVVSVGAIPSKEMIKKWLRELK